MIMKRMTLALVMIASCIMSFGKADEKQLQLVEKSGIAQIFDKSKKAVVVYEFSEDCTASYQGTTNVPFKQYKELNKEWDEEWEEASQGFAEDWNKRNKKGMLIVNGEADYTIKIVIKGVKEMAAWNVWWEIVDGTLEIINNADNKVEVSYKIHEYYEGMSGFKAMKLRNRIKETLAGLSESCLYFAKKEK